MLDKFFTVVFAVAGLVVVVSDACGGSCAVFAFALDFQSCLCIFTLTGSSAALSQGIVLTFYLCCADFRVNAIDL